MKTMTIASTCLIAWMAGTSALATDLTTNNHADPRPLGRYMANIGGDWGETTRQNGGRTGIFEYLNMVQGGTPSWRINDGNPQEYVTTFGGTSPDFAGYRFKMKAATVTGLLFANRTFGDGGSFAAAPDVQYLDSVHGAWQTVPAANVTWDVPYNSSYDDTVRIYNLTITPALTNVWGIRLQGQPQPGVDDVAIRAGTERHDGTPGTGFVGVGELTIFGEVDLGGLDLANNLALGANGIMSSTSSWSGSPAELTDGVITATDDSVDSYGGIGEDFVGVTWSQPQYQVGAMGVVFKWYNDGGLLRDDCERPLRIEYTTDGNTWTPVSGLDTGRYSDEYRNIAMPIGWYPRTAWLFTFDELNDITGLRIIGESAGRDGDVDGFIAAYEVEVFGRPTLASRIDSEPDGDIDRADLNAFNACVSGPNIPYADDCADLDLDGDGDIDQTDFAVVQNCFSGEGNFYVPTCGH